MLFNKKNNQIENPYQHIIDAIVQMGSFFGKSNLKVDVIKEVSAKNKGSFFIEVLIEDRFFIYCDHQLYIYHNENFTQITEKICIFAFLDNRKHIKDVLSDLLTNNQFLNKKEKKYFTKLEEVAELISSHLKLKNINNLKTSFSYLREAHKGVILEYQGVTLSNQNNKIFCRVKIEYNFYPKRIYIKVVEFASSAYEKLEFEIFKNDEIDIAFLNKEIMKKVQKLENSGILKKTNLFQKHDFHPATIALEEDNPIALFNKKLVELLQSPTVRNPQEKNLNELINNIHFNQKILKNKELLIKELNSNYKNLKNIDNELLLICEINLKKTYQLFESEKIEAQNQINQYMLLSQEFLTKELNKLQSTVLTIS